MQRQQNELCLFAIPYGTMKIITCTVAHFKFIDSCLDNRYERKIIFGE